MKLFGRVFLVFAMATCLVAFTDTNFPEIVQKVGDIFESFMKNSTPHGATVMKRPVFGKDHGCLKATFEISKDLDEKFRVGAFKADSYPAWLRFSNDNRPQSDKAKVNRGMSIKLVGVKEGPKLLKGYENAQTQDFIMENHPVFFVDTAQEFLDLNLDFDGFVKAHPLAKKILDDMDRNVLSDPLDGDYWTPTPFRLGDNGAMKYMVMPCQQKLGEKPPNPLLKPMDSDNYLRENLVAHMKEPGEKCMTFYVQLQVDDEQSPIDRATVQWPTTGRGEWKKFATIHIPAGQDIDAPARKQRCDSLSLNVLHATAELAPLGSLNAARAVVYKRIGDVRRTFNNMDLSEPTEIKDGE